jgi:hypothetical protein
MASEPPKVFISYNRADRVWAEWIAGVSKGANYEPILDVWHFRPGENFVLRMHEAATQADLTLALLSEAYLKALYGPIGMGCGVCARPDRERTPAHSGARG